MPKRLTPLEAAAKAATDHRYRYELKMRQEGFARLNCYCPIADLDLARQICKLLGATNGEFRRKLEALVEGVGRE